MRATCWRCEFEGTLLAAVREIFNGALCEEIFDILTCYSHVCLPQQTIGICQNLPRVGQRSVARYPNTDPHTAVTKPFTPAGCAAQHSAPIMEQLGLGGNQVLASCQKGHRWGFAGCRLISSRHGSASCRAVSYLRCLRTHTLECVAVGRQVE